MTVLLEILFVALLAIAVARLAPEPWRGRALNLLKAWVTIRVFWLLFAHPVKMEDGSHVVALQLIWDTLANIDPATFWMFCGLAAAIKFVGILASMQRWIVLLRGQAIELPFRHIFGSFLIGRFIGTFLPSTAGLDGYTLYDAARFTGRTVEVTAAKALEKVIGVTGIFLSFIVALPAGIGMFYSIFDRSTAHLVAGLGIAICATVIGGLMTVLWFPGIVQWLIEHLPLPGKAQMAGIVRRISESAAAYKNKKRLIVLALALSFIVHFTTAAMYYFTAVAISAVGAEFWPIVLGSSLQILATVLSPFTIAGEGIRELAQLVLLQNMIGPAAAIVSAALGFWAAEALTLAGGYFWWVRPADYTPEWCRVNGEQVDYEEAARSAVALETEEDRAAREAAGTATASVPFGERVRLGASYGLGTGIVGGLLVGLGEVFAIASGGFGTEAQVLWYGPLAYAAFFGALCVVGGIVLAALPMSRDEIRGWTPALGLLATAVPIGLAVTVFRLRRDVYAEQMPPLPVLGAVLGGFALLSLLLFAVGPRLFRGGLGNLFKPLPALGLAALLGIGGALATGAVDLIETGGAAPTVIPAHLSERPNLILVMVDTLRADHLSCYGGPVETPNLCRIATDGGTLYDGFSHASWTKPATATLLTSLVPTSHQAMSKPSALGPEIETLAEQLRDHGYATGGFVSNTNLTESFGFAQGFDEYHYLGPDYLFGAEESSSKLVMYQILRRVWFALPLGLHFGDFYQDSEVVNGHAMPWLDRHRDARFFLFLHYMDPHDPYFEHPYNGYGIARASNQHPPASMAEEMHRLYKQEIAYLDDKFGDLITHLEDLGVYDDTVIALVADHGEEFYEHGGFWHGLTLYEEQIHVPLMVKWAKGKPGSDPDARAHVARLIDVAPTLLLQAGAQPADAMQGQDLAMDLATRSEAGRTVFAEEDHEGNVLRAIRTGQWKWIEAGEGNPRGLPTNELFDMVSDRGETTNRIEDEPDVAATMRSHAEGQLHMAEAGKVGEAREAQVTAAECEALMALGYVESCDEGETATP
ncbi:MAG: sulfatase-like hydrolase/transferase [Deltaproteobacteria bacterium]|nr:sulfatase-like hydrolase/transferase [Deltaproteobacteria bacterium]